MAVQTNISSDYLTAFNAPIGVSIMSKLSQWSFLQQLGFNGTLYQQGQTFHGLKDFNNQLSAYSSTHAILTAAWSIIKNIVSKNATVISQTFSSPVLGQVGNLFQQLSGFGQVFAVPPSLLQSPSAISSAVQTASSSSISLPSTTVKS